MGLGALQQGRRNELMPDITDLHIFLVQIWCTDVLVLFFNLQFMTNKGQEGKHYYISLARF